MKGKRSEVLEGAEVVRMNAVLIELGAHCRDSVIDAAQRDAEPARLQSDDLVAGGRLDRIEQAFVRRFAQPHETTWRLTQPDVTHAVPTARRPVDAGISPP